LEVDTVDLVLDNTVEDNLRWDENFIERHAEDNTQEPS